MCERIFLRRIAEVVLFINAAVYLCLGQSNVTDVEILLNQSMTVGSVVSLIEGKYAELKCMSSDSNAVIRWQKADDHAFLINDPKLTVQSVQRSDAGEYRCIVGLSSGNETAQTVTINVLYQPSIPTITGPFKVLRFSNFDLTCHADANPAASYKWTYKDDPASTPFHTGSVLTVENMDTNDIWLHCHAQNTMFPTGDSPQTGTSYTNRQVKMHAKVVIWNVKEQYTFGIGSTLDVKCKSYGLPLPIFWWTKESDEKFMREGDRLIEENVQADFAGVYTCNVENTLQPTNGAEQVTTDSKRTVIKIVDPTVPEVCQNLSCKHTETIQAPSIHTQTTQAPSILTETTQAPSTCPAQAVCGSKTGIIAAAVAGWIIAAIAVLTVVFLCLPCRRKTKGLDSEDSVRNVHIPVYITAPAQSNLNTISTTPRPELPTRPVLTKKGSEPIYLELCPEDSREGNNPYDYVEPTEEKASSVINKPRSPPDGYEEPLRSDNQTERFDRLKEDNTDNNITNSSSPDSNPAPVHNNQPDNLKRLDSYENPEVSEVSSRQILV